MAVQKFEFRPLELSGAYLIRPFYADDERGGLLKDYNIDTFKSNGIEHELKEVFYTISKKGVIRAIHFQLGKQQAKLVRCVKGHVYDIIVDLRPNSPTYGKYLGFDLTEENMLSLYVPEYFGHGYLVLENSIVSYKCAEVFYGEGDSGIMYNDPDINVNWDFDKIGGADKLIISDKDKKLMSFKEYGEVVDKTIEREAEITHKITSGGGYNRPYLTTVFLFALIVYSRPTSVSEVCAV